MQSQPNSGGGVNGVGGGGTTTSHQSLHDVQRFQQHLQSAQFRQQQQQQFGGGGVVGSAGSAASQLAAMQQQHQGHHSMSGMSPSTAALAAMMQQQNQLSNGTQNSMLSSHLQSQQQHHGDMLGNSNLSNSNMADGGGMQQGHSSFGSNWNTPLPLQPQHQQQQLLHQQMQQQHHLPQSVPSPMDSSTGTSARLMAMAGMAGMGGGGNNPNFATGMHGGMSSHNAANASALGLVGAGGSSGSMVGAGVGLSQQMNSTNSSNASGIQNMQAALFQQRQRQQQQQGNLTGQHSQQQQRSMMMSGIPTSFNSNPQQQQQQQQHHQPHQQNAIGAGSGAAGMLQGLGMNANNDSAPSQQQLLFQQQLATMQKQQLSGGGGSVAANAAMVAMHNMQQQQSGGSNLQHPPSRSNSLLNPSSLSELQLQQQQQGVSQQAMIQARQQQLLQQMQQQSQQQQQRGMMLGDNGMGTDGTNSTSLMQQQMQQHRHSGNQGMLQQMSNSATGMMAMMQQHQQQQPSQMGTGIGQLPQSHEIGNLGSQQHSMLHQQQLQSDSNTNSSTSMMGSSFQQHGMMGMANRDSLSGLGSRNTTLGENSSISGAMQFADNLSEHSGMQSVNDPSSLHNARHHQRQGSLNSTMLGTDSNGGGAGGASTSGTVGSSTGDQTSYLDGRFAGGWQSNADLPERRRVIFNILEVIRQMRPETSKLSNKLPHMAKSLEEHLYRSAKSKEDYMDLSTLKKRLQAIAHGLEIHRSSDSPGTVSQGEQPMGLAQLGASLRNGDGTNSQNSNFSSSVRATSGGGPGMSGMSMPMNAGNPNLTSQVSGSSQMGNVAGMHQSNPIPLQGNVGNIGLQRTGSPGNFMTIAAQQQQVARQRSDSWQVNQSSGTDNLLMSQAVGMQQHQHQQDNMFQMNNQNSVNPIAQQRNPSQLMGSNLVDDRQESDMYASSSNIQPSQHDFANSTNNMSQQDSSSWGSFVPSNSNPLPSGSSEYPILSKFQDPTASQKKKVIVQQQQRLLLLRHASKCNLGPQCTTKFCDQMVTLWKHMKTCRNKNCKTSHCLSSRCVLNHYRICKSNGRTSTCEVCGPVMLKIKQQERDDGSAEDPLTREQDTQLQPQVPLSATSLQGGQDGSDDNEQSQLYQMQAQQSKLKAQLDSLKVLQRQQEQLLEQQKSLEMQAQTISDPNSPHARQLQEQQMLLQQLQKRCQQQQLLVQDELQMHASGSLEEQGNPFESLQEDQSEMGPPVDEPKPVAQEPQQVQKTRRGSGIGKRFGKSLGLPAARKAEMDDSALRKKRPSVTKADRSSKKPRSGSKSKISPISEVGMKEEIEDSTTPTRKLEAAGTSLLAKMTRTEIQKHLESLNKRIVLSSRTVTHKCRPIIQEILDDQFGWVFRDAVDPVALGLPDYYDVIKNPMHLDLIRKKLENAIYSDMESFARDTRLVFDNAILYNGESSEVGELAQIMLSRFDKLYYAVVQDIESSHMNLESQGELCSLCGIQKRRFEPTVLYCQGKGCMQRIKRNAAYFTDRTKLNHWCDACFAQLDPNEPIPLDDGSKVLKKELQELKNDALPEESWVNCDECHSWVHQICALFNGRTNKSSASFTCPTCYLKVPRSAEFLEKAGKNVKGSLDLPTCKMSDAIEKGLADALQSAYASRASELGVSVDDVETVESLCVRVLSNVGKRHFVGEKMLQRYSSQGYPSEFPVRSKCIGLFQKIHGVDTLLFAMYVYEYGHECPPPNKRRVYISYIDSVQYFEPKCYRTIAYQAIIIEYLRYVKQRGFHTAAMWSCPPVGGDDYIFYCHPKHQLIPQEDMLRSWYHKMLDQAKNQGVVIRTTTLYDEYFSSDSVEHIPGQRRDPTCLPYFEGDYIPGEIENIVQHLQAKDDVQHPSSAQDSVMVRLGHSIKKMKDNFIVVHLRNRRFAAAVERGEDVSNWKEDSDDDMLRSKRAKISGKSATEPESPGKNDLRAIVDIGVDSSLSKQSDGRLELKEDAATNIGVPVMDGGTESTHGEKAETSALSDDRAVKIEDRASEVSVAGEGFTEPVDVDTELKSPLGSQQLKEKVEGITESASVEKVAVLSASTIQASGEGESKIVQHPTAESTSEMSNVRESPSTSNGKEDMSRPKVAHLGEPVQPVDVPEPAANGNEQSNAETVNPRNVNALEENLGSTEVKQVAKAKDSEDNTPGKDATTLDKVEDGDSGSNVSKMREVSSRLEDSTNIAESAHEGGDSSVLEDPDLMSKGPSLDTVEGNENVQADNVAQKRALEEIKPAISRHMSGMSGSSAIVGDTTDDDPPMESDMFESRQQFLNYCQNTHCQFDDLRRAKHSTVMVLFQLHNPLAPKFLQQCGACYRDITHGVYFHCNDCSSFDLCEECHEPVTTGAWAKRDPRFAHDTSHSFTPVDMEGDEEVQKSQGERQKGLKAHIDLIEHAATCAGSPGCSLLNCERMKKLFNHVPNCAVTPKKDCKVCTRLFALCTMHSRLCMVRNSCAIPFCDRIRERNKRLRRQQQLMDDRRRQAQNELYHAGGQS